jgi:hypothetical protein
MQLVKGAKSLGKGGNSGSISDENSKRSELGQEHGYNAKGIGRDVEFFEIGASGETRRKSMQKVGGNVQGKETV